MPRWFELLGGDWNRLDNTENMKATCKERYQVTIRNP